MDEIKATYGETAELKIILKNANGDSRTITLADPKSDTALTTATAAFAELVLNTETNVFMVNGENPVSMVADLVTTDRTNIGEYGQTEIEPALIVQNITLAKTAEVTRFQIEGYVEGKTYTLQPSIDVTTPTNAIIVVNGSDIVVNPNNDTGVFGYVLSDGTRNCYFTITLQ